MKELSEKEKGFGLKWAVEMEIELGDKEMEQTKLEKEIKYLLTKLNYLRNSLGLETIE